PRRGAPDWMAGPRHRSRPGCFMLFQPGTRLCICMLRVGCAGLRLAAGRMRDILKAHGAGEGRRERPQERRPAASGLNRRGARTHCVRARPGDGHAPRAWPPGLIHRSTAMKPQALAIVAMTALTLVLSLA